MGGVFYAGFNIYTAEGRLKAQIETLRKDTEIMNNALKNDLKAFFSQSLLKHESREDRKLYKASIATIFAVESKGK